MFHAKIHHSVLHIFSSSDIYNMSYIKFVALQGVSDNYSIRYGLCKFRSYLVIIHTGTGYSFDYIIGGKIHIHSNVMIWSNWFNVRCNIHCTILLENIIHV